MKRYKKIKNDVFNIAKQVKGINNNLVVVFNKRFNRLEVHNNKFKKTPTEFVLPFKQLNKKTLVYILKNLKKSNTQKIKEIDSYNQKLKDNIHTKELQEREYKLKEIYKYANSGSKEYNADESYKNVWF